MLQQEFINPELTLNSDLPLLIGITLFCWATYSINVSINIDDNMAKNRRQPGIDSCLIKQDVSHQPRDSFCEKSNL